MIPMPYILVNIVLDILSVILFCVTSAALLSRYPFANLYLPARLRNQRILAFVAHGLVLSVLSIVVDLLVPRLRAGYTFSPFIFDMLWSIGIINSVVLAYQFLDKRYFLNSPQVQRRLLLAIGSLVMTLVPFLAAVTAVVGLFVIK